MARGRKKGSSKTPTTKTQEPPPKFRLIIPPLQPKIQSLEDESLQGESSPTGSFSDSTESDLPEHVDILAARTAQPSLKRSSDSQSRVALKRSLALAPKITVNSDEEDQLSDTPPVSPPPLKRVKSVSDGVGGKKKEADRPSWADKLVLLIPVVSAGKSGDVSNQRKSLRTSTDFDDALRVIHDTIGCSMVKRMPELRYKLSSKPQKDKPVSLQTDEDWDGLRETLEEEQKRKKAVVEVSIIVAEQYLDSLRSFRADGKSKPSNANQSSRKRKGNPPIMDLNVSADDDDDGDHGGLAEKEKEMHQTLERTLTRCQMCGPTKFCKISVTGEHINLSFHQRRGWALALAQEMHNVTLSSPPVGPLFAQFHGSSTLRKALATPITPQTPTPTLPPHGFMPPHMGAFSPYMVQPWLHMPPPFPYNPATSSRRDQHASQPSSDPPDDGQANPYPEIEGFITQLHEQHPRRNLDRYISEFATKDYYNIDELAKMSEERLTTEIGLTSGNAQFLLAEVKREMKLIDRKNGKRRVQ